MKDRELLDSFVERYGGSGGGYTPGYLVEVASGYLVEVAGAVRRMLGERVREADHHASERGRPVRTVEELREYISGDHPCCIGVGDAVALLGEVDRVRSLLPEELGDRKIEFVECEKGHGRLVAENWLPVECPRCVEERLEAQVVAERESRGRSVPVLGAEVDRMVGERRAALAAYRVSVRALWEIHKALVPDPLCPPDPKLVALRSDE